MSFRTTGYNYNSTDIGSFFCDLSNNQIVHGTKTFADLPVDASSNTFATRSWVTANTPSTSTTVTTTSLATTLASYATTAALASYATTAALASYATTTSLANYLAFNSLPSSTQALFGTNVPATPYTVTLARGSLSVYMAETGGWMAYGLVSMSDDGTPNHDPRCQNSNIGVETSTDTIKFTNKYTSGGGLRIGCQRIF